MIKWLPFLFCFSLFGTSGLAQTTTVNVDLTASPNITKTYEGYERGGNDCRGTNCIIFNITLNPGSDLVNFTTDKVTNSSWYTIDCGPLTSLNTPACISGKTQVKISFCKVGADDFIYTLTASTSVKASDNITVRAGCSAPLSVVGLDPATAVWTSVFPGAEGAYNSMLSCTSACASTTFTPGSTAPAYIDYRVSGTVSNCPNSRSDTVRVYVVPGMAVSFEAGNTVICSGAAATLSTNVTGGNSPYTYSWIKDGVPISNTTASISVTSIGTYEVSVGDNTNCTPVTQSIAVTAAPTPAAPTANGTDICVGSTATLNATAPGGAYEWYDAAAGGNLLGSNATYITPALSSTKTYYVQTIFNGCTSPRTAVDVVVNAMPDAPTVAGIPICSGNTGTLTATAPGGSYEWYSAVSGGLPLGNMPAYTTPALTSTTTYYVQTTVNGCTSARTAVTVTVNPTPVAPTASGAAICNNTSTTLVATAPEGNYEWYEAESGGLPIKSSSSYTTPALTATTTYYVQTVVNGCPSARRAVTVMVDAVPDVPTISRVAICNGTSTTLTPTAPGGMYQWFSQASGGTPLATAASYITPTLTSSTTYYVQTVVNGCVSSRVPVTVTVNPIPAAPTVLETTICSGNTALLTATAPGGNYEWYDAASGGIRLGSGDIFTTPALTATTTYYVQTTVNGCTGPRRSVTVTVIPTPAAPTAASPAICAGTSATLTATAPGGSYKWYDAAAGGNLLSSTPNYITPVLTTTTVYYVETTVTGCTSTRTTVTVTVNPLPVAPTASDEKICSGNAKTLTATAPGGVYRWYSAAVSGTLFATNASYTTPVLTTTTTYYVEAVSAQGCSGPRTAVTVTVIPEEDAGFTYSSGTYCVNSTVDPIPTVVNPAGGTFSSTAGLSINSSSGEIDVSASLVGTYTITFVASTTCSSSYNITITAAPKAEFSYPRQYCHGESSPATPNFGSGASAGVFDATPSGLAFVNDLTGEIDLHGSAPGRYLVRNRIASIGGCEEAIETNEVVIKPTPVINSAEKTTICNNTSPAYTITSTLNTADYTWTRNAITGINNSLPGSGTGQLIDELLENNTSEPIDVIYKITPSFDGCNGQDFVYTVTVNPTLTSISPDAETICNKSTLSYQVTSSVSDLSYVWSRNAIIGINNSQAGSGTDQFINELLENDTSAPIEVIYMISPSLGVCTGAPFSYKVTVNPTPAVINDFPAALCNNVTQNHEIRSDVNGTTFRWSRAAVAGIDNLELTGQTTTFITDQLKNVTSSPIDVIYRITPLLNGCEGPEFIYTVTINPTPIVTSDLSAVICNNSIQDYEIKSNVNGAVFKWSRASVPNIDNSPAVSQTGNLINEQLKNISTAPIEVVYKITSVINNCEEPMALYRVTVNPTPDVNAGPASICSGTAQNYTISGNVSGTTFSWSRPAVNGISNQLVMNQAGAISEVLNNITDLPVEVKYYINPTAGGCNGPQVIYAVMVNPAVKVISDDQLTICNNTPQNYLIASNVTGASFTWSRASVAGIRNQPATGQTNTITESLENITDLPISVTYSIMPSGYGCNGLPFTYTVKVNPTPEISGSAGVTICNNIKHSYQISSNITSSSYTWSRAHVTGISNSEQLTGTGDGIEETLNNTTSAPIDVLYKIVPLANNCAGPEFLYTVRVNPTPKATSVAVASICSNVPHSYTIAGEVENISFTWSRDAVIGIDNPPVSSQAGTSISETLLNTTATVKDVSYKIIPSANNCNGPEFTYLLKVYPTPVIKSALSAEICNNRAQDYEIISNVSGATFKWSRARVNGIRNDDVVAQTGNFIRESLENITTAPIEVVYKITALADNCEGPVAFYRLTVNPTSNVISVPSTSICNSMPHTYTIIGNVANTSFTWSRDAVDGISNLPASNQPEPNISETLTNTGDVPVEVKYYIYPTANGCNGPMFTYTVTVNPTVRMVSGERDIICNNRPQNYRIISNVSDATFTWSRPFVEGIENPTTTGQTSMITERLRNTSTVPVEVAYEIIPSINGCQGAGFSYRVTVNPTPVLNSVSTANICNNIAQDYQITSDVNNAGFNWSRTEVEGISNVAVTDQTSDVIAELLINTTSAPINVVYKIIPSADGCRGPEFTYTVTVNPTLIVNSALSATVCNNTPHSYPITSNVSTATFTWSRDAVAGIDNLSAPPQAGNTIRETLVNNTDLPIVVPYHITPSINGCGGSVYIYNLTVKPTPRVTNASLSQVVCSTSSSVAIVPESNVTGATFAWTATASPGITGFIPSGAGTIPAQTLRNALPGSGTITYKIRPSFDGCIGVAANYVTTVLNQVPVTPLVTNYGPLCVGKSLSLSTQEVAGATYSWTGPNGFTSTSRTPVINNIAVADEGIYSATITVGQCAASANTTVIVNTPAIVVAGNDQTVCANNAVIEVSGTVAGGSRTGIWISSGTGIFPSGATALNGTYVPSEADKVAGDVVLTLTATNTASCEATTSSFHLFTIPAPVISAGGNRVICAYEPLVLTGQSTTADVQWTSSGSGTFLPGNTSLNAKYMPSRNDKINGSVTITLSTEGPSNCIPVTHQINLLIVTAPTVELGDDVYAFEGEGKVLNPIEITGNDLQYLWMPNINLNDNTLRNPTFTGTKDTRYTVTVTGTAGCKVVDRFFVKVLKPITVPNAFSPNGDGLNDTWSPQQIDNYPGAVISIFNRFGVKLYGGHARDIAWDGTYKGSPLPVGMYYYILDLKKYGKSMSGNVMIIR